MLPYELDEVWEILREEPPEVWKVYCGTRRHMDFDTCIAGITYRFNEQFFKELLTPAAIPGRHKPKPATRKKGRHVLHRLDQLGVMTPRTDLGGLVFFYPRAAAHQSVQKRRGQRGANEWPDELPEKPLQINCSDTGCDIGETEEVQMRGPPHVITVSGNTTTTTHSSYSEGGEAETCDSECGGGGGGGEEEEKSRQEATPPPAQFNIPLFCPVPTALIYPKGLCKAERRVGHRMVAESGDQAQALLDELAAVMQAGKVRVSPLSCLRGMVQRATAGTFVPEAGIPIAEARRQKAQTAARVQAAENRPPAVPEEPAPESPEQTSHRRREAAATGIGFAKAALKVRGCRSP